MNTDAYSLSDSYVSVGGGDGVVNSIEEFARKWVTGHYMIAFALIVFLTIFVLWMLIWKCKEKFNPTQSMRFQTSDQFGLSGKENLTGAPGTDRSQSVFAQQVQDANGNSFTINPNAAAGQPGSLAYQVLHSSDFNCDNRQPVGSDAWSWMNGVAHENMQGAPKNDNDFSKVLAGR